LSEISTSILYVLCTYFNMCASIDTFAFVNYEHSLTLLLYCLQNWSSMCKNCGIFQSTHDGQLSGYSYHNLTIPSHQEVPLSVEWPRTQPFHNYEKKALTVMANNSTIINKTNNNLTPQLIKHITDHDISIHTNYNQKPWTKIDID